MPMLSDIAQAKKIDYFLTPLPRDAAPSEIGCGARWVGDYLRRSGYTGCVGNDLFSPANIVGDIRQWPLLRLKPESFDAIVAFEVVEHVDLFQEADDLLKPGGQLLLTSPVPEMDWAMQMLKAVGLNQKRTGPHDHLIDFRTIPLFEAVAIRRVAGLSQWGTFKKSQCARRRGWRLSMQPFVIPDLFRDDEKLVCGRNEKRAEIAPGPSCSVTRRRLFRIAPVVAAFGDTRRLAGTTAQVVKFRAPHRALADDDDAVDVGRIKRKDALDAFAERHFAHGEVRSHALVRACDAHAFEILDAGTFAFDHFHTNLQRVAGAEYGNSLCHFSNFFGFNRLDEVHDPLVLFPLSRARGRSVPSINMTLPKVRPA